MATNVDSWIPIEYSSEVIQKVNQVSAMEAFARPEPMGSNSKSVPRSSGMDVGLVSKGSAYGEDTSPNDSVTLTASKFGKILRVADEDLNDSLANIILSKTKDWGVSYAKAIDNACLAVTAAPAAGIPFSSVYYALTQSNSNTSYTANANLTTSATATYAGLSGSLAKYEQGDYFDEGSSLAIAHPRFKDLLRTLVDLQGRPLFVDAPANGFAGTLLGVPVRWSNGAKTSAVNTSKPAGHPLIVFGNRDFLILGKRSGPETAFAPPDSGAAFATDEALLKIRARRGFAVGNENAFSVYEYSGS